MRRADPLFQLVQNSQRDVKPLGLFFWGNVWTR